ncbi:hypothetical protein GCM10011521_17280 [Arenimonas soli]|uniref:TonB C-terminal domain-containing protein n=1 Tax=Arenimonas soli TaxID=2269504 RepID=A0ABQ1HIP0_9GAMM|nr:hypothetical protein [Arenimonas soli]GGA79572.1 hypothetical protein GCM10011521_17280 [Arenimonas soli]
MKYWMAGMLLALAGSAQAADTARFTAEVEGTLTIGTEGQVLDVQLRDADWMGEPVVEGYLLKIRGWRFEPVVENGEPVNATSPMRLRLAALRNDAEKTARFAIEQAWFPDPEQSRELPAGMKRHPVYPADAARNGVGAVVILVARVDAQGVPEDVAVEYLHLTGRDPGSHGRRLAGQFVKATQAAARRWRIDGADARGLVRIPVKYTPPAFSPPRAGWERVYPVTLESPAWLAGALAGEAQVLDLAANGTRASSKLRLLTPLDPRLDG